jgi:hypothetical protein
MVVTSRQSHVIHLHTLPGIMSHLFAVVVLDAFDVLLGVLMYWNSVSTVSVVIVMMSSISATGVGAL